MTMSHAIRPVMEDVAANTGQVNRVLDALVTGEIKVLPLFECDAALFEALRDETVALSADVDGQPVEDDHPTTVYVRKFDSSWHVKPGVIRQYSLYNSKDDVLFNDEDHHWLERPRRFNSRLRAVPAFVERYFPGVTLQNFRMQLIRGGGDLGQHREKIIGIPGRERQLKLRFHLPIVTNPEVRFLMDGQSFHMKAGWVHLFNQACMHGVSNDGANVRVHLIFDCYLDEYIACDLIAPSLSRGAGVDAARVTAAPRVP